MQHEALCAINTMGYRILRQMPVPAYSRGAPLLPMMRISMGGVVHRAATKDLNFSVGSGHG
jgi:hypothetical protein